MCIRDSVCVGLAARPAPHEPVTLLSLGIVPLVKVSLVRARRLYSIIRRHDL